MKPIGRMVSILSASALFCGVASAQQTNVLSTGLVSEPAGVCIVSVPAASEVLLSVPFDPFGSSLSDVLRGQLTAFTNGNSDLIRFWDADSGIYRTYEKNVSGEWIPIEVGTNVVPELSDPPDIEPGQGFVVANRQDVPQQVMLAGRLVLDWTRAVRLPSGAALVGYPYSSAKPAAETAIGNAGGTITGNAFELAAGYWHLLTNAAESVWTEPRPYDWPFALKPTISIDAIVCDAEKGEATLRIAMAGGGTGTVDLLKRDIGPADRIGEWRGWTLLAGGVPLEAGKPVVWTDRTLRTDPAFKGVRLYVAACSGAAADMDGNGVPDARQWLCSSRGTTATNFTDDVGGDPVSNANSVSNESATSDSVADYPFLSRRFMDVVFVSVLDGSDRYTGTAPALEFRTQAEDAPIGPKRTIREGLRTVSAGGTLVITEGLYREDLNISGRRVNVVIRGDVSLSNRAKQSQQ